MAWIWAWTTAADATASTLRSVNTSIFHYLSRCCSSTRKAMILIVHAIIIMCHRRTISLKRRWWSQSSVGVLVIMLLRVRESVRLMSIRMCRAIGNQFCMTIINFIFLIALYVHTYHLIYGDIWMIDLWLMRWSTTYDDSLKEFAAETTMMSTTTRYALASSQRMSFRHHNTYDNGSSRSSNDNLSRNSNRHSFSGFQQHMTATQQKQQLRNNSRRSSLIYGKVQNPLSSINNAGFP